MNENAAYIFEIETPEKWTFDGDAVWIRGWFISKVDAVFSDIRAVIDGVPHLGILGIPRPDIEQRHRGKTGQPHAGFLLRVRPPRRARELRLELLDAGNNWVEIWRTRIKVQHGENTIGRYNLALLPDQLRQLLQARRATPEADLTPLADRLALRAASVPTEINPAAPFVGGLAEPALQPATQFGKVRVEGWIFHEHSAIRRLLASTQPRVVNELDFGRREQPDVARSHPANPRAARSGFFGLVDLDENAPAPAIVSIFAELEDGTTHLVFSRRFHPRVCHVWEQPLPAFSRAEFLDSARALHRAATRHRLRLGKLGARWRALLAAYRQFQGDAPAMLPPPAAAHDPYADWQHNHRLTPRVREVLTGAAARVAETGLKFTVLADLRAGSAADAPRLLASLQAQIYPHWELILVGDQRPAQCSDARCSFERAEGPKKFIAALNAAAARATGNLITLIPVHGQFAPDALVEIAERFASSAATELVYTDEDRIDRAGRRSEPAFKPEWSPSLALSTLFPGHLAVIRREKLAELRGFRDGTERLAWHDVLLRLGDRLAPAQVTHVAAVAFHGAAEAAREFDYVDPIYEQSRSALADAVRRRGWPADPFLSPAGYHRRAPVHQLQWKGSFLAHHPVTIVIPTRDKLHLLQECIELLEETIDWQHAKLVIVDDHSRDADAVRYLERIQRRTDVRCTVVRLPDAHAPFNYSRLVNAALPHVDTPLVLHLNNDVNALERGWLEEMAGWFTQPDVGVVGAKLVFPDKTLNHTGIVIGPHGGLADTPFAKADERTVDLAWHAAAREVSAVTGACLMTRAELYRQLGGFDEQDFGVAYNDVDYCLRARAAGFRVIYTPQAKLMHWGSATRGVTFDETEHVAWLKRYPAFRDPYFSPHWQLDGNRVRCAGAAPARTGRVGALRLLLLTHNLNLEGAPLFLLEYARWMAGHAGFRIEVLAAQDGPLRAAYEALGAHITIADTAPLYAAPDEEAFHGRLLDLAHQVDWEHVDVVVCNTLVSFWGVLLAQRAGKPSLFYIHESTSVDRFFGRKLAAGLQSLVHDALGSATRTLFLCAATRRYYEDDNRHGNFRIVPSWIQLDEIAAFRAAHSREAMRRKHGFRDDEVIIANIGTVCERKGQHIFIRAIDQFNRRHGRDGLVRFVMVGARPGIYLDLLQRDIARLGLTNATLVPETREVFDFFVAADMFVCTSYEESFPRVVMEAMAFKTPIVSTDVHGIAELIGQRQDGYLVAAGDVDGLVRMMHTCLAKERSGKSLAGPAYSKVLRYCDATKVLPYHADLAREAFLAHE